MAHIRWEGTIDAAHFIPGHPKCGRLHGHTYGIVIEIEGPIPPEHPFYLIDYGKIKGIVDMLDHVLLLPEQHAAIKLTTLGWENADKSMHFIKAQWPDGEVTLRRNAAFVLPLPETSTECLVEWLAHVFHEGIKNDRGIDAYVYVELSETAKTKAFASCGQRPLPFLLPPVGPQS